MEEKQNWLTIASVVLVVAALGVFLYRQSQQQPEEIDAVNPNQVAQERADQLLENLNIEIPDDAERINLQDKTGGEAAGIATRREESGAIEQSLLVALPEPAAGEFYEAYLISTVEEDEPLYLGRLRSVKGGWMLDYILDAESTNYDKIQVTRETTDDHLPEEVVLEGEFSQQTTKDSEPETKLEDTNETQE